MENKYSKEEMLVITSKVINYLDQWQLQAEEMMIILGIPEVKPRHLPKYRKMETALPQTDEIFSRIDHIVGIADALRTTYPFSDKMRVMWLRKPHRRFRKNTPLSMILKEGVDGLMRVRVEVDCAYGWAIGDAMNAATKAAAASKS
ncbi:MAG TPA: DUF2384 domain-containing protein [Gammaproteobacteria bacterium]|nr:DUF2384 domain-containing protein [Gammaproteobacteria bacterium]